MTTQNADLSNKAMLVRLAVSQWSVRKYDRKVSMKVAQDYHTTANCGRYTKVLLATTAIEKISKVANMLRSYHYENTLPWYDWGPRLLPAANYLEYTRKIQAFKTEFEKAVSGFVQNYTTYVDDARQRLNGMFDPKDYPSPASIASYFSFKMSVDPLPTAPDFRVDLNSEAVLAIQKDIEARTQEATTVAMRELWTRLHDAVNNMVERLSDEKSVFRDSLVGNIKDLVDLLPRMNIAGDEDLEAMRCEVEKRLCGYQPDQLRQNKENRRKVAKSAKSILDEMSGYMGGA